MAIFAGKNSKFRIGANVVAKRVSISGINVTVGKFDATDLDDTNVVNKPTLPDPGEVSITYNVDLSDSTHLSMLEDFGTEQAMSIEYDAGVSNKYLNFRGWISANSIGEANPTNWVQGTCVVTLVTMPTLGSSAVTS